MVRIFQLRDIIIYWSQLNVPQRLCLTTSLTIGIINLSYSELYWCSAGVSAMNNIPGPDNMCGNYYGDNGRPCLAFTCPRQIQMWIQ